MGSGQDLLPIGQFSEACRLSLKALRVYDRLGLLRPVHVDKQTGYRYYHEDQIRAARLISMIRRLEMPLALIKDVLVADPVTAEDHVTRFWAETERRIGEGQRIVAYVSELIRGGTPVAYEVRTREVEDGQALSVTREVFVRDLPAFIDAAAKNLYGHVADLGGRTDGHLTVIYHGEVGEESNGPVEVCLPVRRGSVPPREDMRLVELPAGVEAYTTITGAQLRFPEILKAYDAVHAWMKRNGRRPAGPPREIYFSDVDHPGPNDPVCDVAWPVL
ncbi:MAG TPA: MerR family transcriptional regulator [bacterium]|nr:MerR family transcriptional regulator [bacterium]